MNIGPAGTYGQRTVRYGDLRFKTMDVGCRDARLGERVSTPDGEGVLVALTLT